MLIDKIVSSIEKRIIAMVSVGFTAIFLLFYAEVKAQKDLPAPPSNQQTVLSGSFVVPMDNNYQSIVPAGQAPFNLKAYGLINEFLQNGIPVKWAIRAGKQKDDVDFTAMAERISPSFLAASSLSFRSGPFIVPDTTLPCGLSTREIIQSFGSNVAVYKLTQNVLVDVRYTLTHRPKIAVFNNGGNQIIHTRILDAAGIKEYEVMDAADIANLMNCYTFVSEPHVENQNVSATIINTIRAFVMNGGNFLAQCHAIDAYENQGFYMTTSGITVVNTTVSHHYPNPDLAYAQFNGVLQENEGGSIHNFTLNPGSAWRPFVYRVVSNLETDTVVAMGAHLIAPSDPGGNVFYLGGHDYSKGKNTIDLSTLAKVNALRMYLNCALVPSGKTNGAWANAGLPALVSGCDDGVTLGCTPTGPPGSTFLWTPAEGLSCTTCPNPIAIPIVSTTYKVLVTNGCTATDTVRVEVSPTPAADFSSNTVCEGSSTSFTNTSSGTTFWHWDFGDAASGAGNTSSMSNPEHVYSKSGNFVVTLITGTSTKCADTVIKAVTVAPLPLLKTNTPEICAGQEATLTVSGADNFTWSTGETGNKITVKPSGTATYTVKGILGNCVADTVVTVTVVPPVQPTIHVTPVSCEGGSNGTATVVLTGGKPDFVYRWNTVPEQTTPQAVNLQKGLYTVTIKDAVGCSAVAVAEVAEMYPLPVIRSSIGGEGCTPFCITVSDYSIETTDPIREWYWSFGDAVSGDNISSEPHPSHCYQKQGNYKVTLRVVTEHGCSSSAEIEGTIVVHSSPVVDLGGDKTICMEREGKEPLVLNAGRGKKYLWQPTGDTTQFLAVKAPGVYSVSVENGFGCSASDQVVICDGCDPRIFVSNAFSPNIPPDGENDLYTVHGKYDTDFHMLIFNRWGEIIFESKDRNEAWDGYYRGEPMPIGVYPWIITYKGSCGDNQVRTMEGSVTVVR